MNFLSPAFLWALPLAAAPVLIHLLNRRRHRRVEWAAMDLLREALHRNRRFLVLRDLLLLALRTLAVLLFILAMTRPYRVSTAAAGFAGEPIHAVLAVDNSQSMGYAQLDKSLLDVAKERAATFLRELPDGSKVSLVPMCDYAGWYGKDVYATRTDALEALQRIELVDRQSRSSTAAERAARACRAAKDLPTKRVVFLSDMQRESWGAQDLSQFFREVPDLQIARVGPEKRSNTWVSALTLRDGAADARTPAVFVAEIRHEGDAPRSNVGVTLRLGGEVIEQRRVDLLPDQSLEVVFRHTFDVAGTAAKPLFVPARVELTPDHLPGDDFRTLVVPVVARLPVVFIDQHGPDESPRRNAYGETFPLRRLLAPRTSRQERDKQLVEVRHRKPDDVTRDDLKDARLVALAGVQSPPSKLVGLLREYVRQGGQLFLAAGAGFDPVAWQSEAWREGAGILPAPLKPEPIGKLPEPDAIDPDVFRLAPATMQDPVFYLGLPPRAMEGIFLSPFFFKAVGVDMQAARAELPDAAKKRLEERVRWLAENDAAERRWADLENRGKLDDTARARREADRLRRRELQPNWLLWSNLAATDLSRLSVEERVQRTMPRVMGRYDNGEPFAVRRDIGRGRIILVTTGIFPEWNNLAAEHSVLLLDQALRDLLTRSLPRRTFGDVNEVIVPIDSADQAAAFTVTGPGDEQPRPLTVEALSETTYGLILRDVQRRGLYRIERSRPGEALGAGEEWSMLLAVNGPPAESELDSVGEQPLRERMTDTPFRWVAAGEEIRLEGMARVGHNYWKYLMAMVLACLAIEMLFLAAPRLGRSAP